MLQEIGINYLSQVVEFFVYVGFFICFTNVKVEQKYRYYLAVLAILAVLQVIVEYNNVLKGKVACLEFISMVLILSFIIKESKIRRICYSVGVYVFVGFLDILYSTFLLWITGKEYAELYDYCVFLIFILIQKIIMKRWKKVERWKIPRFSVKIFLAVTVLYFSGAGLLVRVCENVLKQGDFNKKELINVICIVAGIFIISIVLIISCVQLVHEQEKVELLQKYQKMQCEYFDAVQKQDMEIRKFRHDTLGHIECVRELLRNQEYKKATEYLSQIEQVVDRTPGRKYKCNHTVISALVNYLGKGMERSKIEFDFFYHVNGNLKMTDFECCTLLYNLLKNGMEECNKIETGERKIVLTLENFEQNLKIVVSNSISRDFDFQYIEKKITSKNDKLNHGIGLSNIKEVIEHYQGDIRYTVEKDMVSAEIILFHVVKC